MTESDQITSMSYVIWLNLVEQYISDFARWTLNADFSLKAWLKKYLGKVLNYNFTTKKCNLG